MTHFEDHFLSGGNENLGFHWVEWKTADQERRSMIRDKPDELCLLCVHGSYQTCHTWQEFAACVLESDANLRVIGLDLRGHGDSEHARSYSLVQMIKDIEVFIERVGLSPEKTVLVGMSLGGLISLGVAVDMPSLLGLVVVDITPSLTQAGSHEISQNMQKTQELESFESFVQWAHGVNPSRPLDNLRSRLRYALKQTEHGTWTWKYDSQFAATMISQQSHFLWKKLPSIKCDMLLVRGGLSKMTAEDDCHRVVQLVNRAILIQIDNAGHSVQGDQPREFSLSVIKLIERAKRR